MSIASRETPDAGSEVGGTSDPDGGDLPLWYDRSSLVGDFMVTIEGQTEEEFFRFAPENRFCEFIDGIVYMPSPVGIRHQFDVPFLLILLQLFCQERRAGIVLTGPAALRLRPGCVLEPDLFVLPADGRSQIHDNFCDPPVLLVVEVLSPSTRSHDLLRKSALYRQAGVPEVYFIDARDRVVIVERNGTNGATSGRVESGVVLSESIPGFWFEPDWLWAGPEPNALDCLNRVLTGLPA